MDIAMSIDKKNHVHYKKNIYSGNRSFRPLVI